LGFTNQMTPPEELIRSTRS